MAATNRLAGFPYRPVGKHSPEGRDGFFAGLGLQPAQLLAITAGLAELGGGILLGLGLVTPFAAFAIAVVMVTTVSTVHWKNGCFSGNGGYEFNLLIYAVAVGLAAAGPGRFSVDHAASWDDNLSGLWWGVGVLVASVVVGLATIELSRFRSRRRLTTLPV